MRISRTGLNALKGQMRGESQAGLSMHPIIRSVKMAFFGRNASAPYFIGSAKLAGRKITFMSTDSLALAEVKNKEGNLIGIMKAERDRNTISTVGSVPHELMREFEEAGLVKKEEYYPSELKRDKLVIMNSINLGLPVDKRFSREEVLRMIELKKAEKR